MPGDYDFELSQEQEQRARDLHGSSIRIDMCSMGPGGPALFNELDERMVAARIPAHRHPFTRLTLATSLPYALAAEGNEAASEAFRRFCSGHTAASFLVPGLGDAQISQLGQLTTWIDAIPWMGLANKAADFREAQARGTYLTYGFCQPTAAGLPRDLDRFDEARELGVRSVMLTYNIQDYVGAGCTERTNAGLSHYGLAVVEKLNSLGVIVDTSHCGPQTTLDACELSRAPVTANHTSAGALYSHDRSKSDDEIRAVAQTGGVIGVYAVPFFLAPAASRPGMPTMLDQIDYMANLVGWEHVGIGTDWPYMAPGDIPADMVPLMEDLGFRKEHELGAEHLDGYSDARDFMNITRGLVARGYDDDAIRGILGGNYLRVFESVCG